MAGQSGKFQVVARVVAGQAVDLGFVREVEVCILPAIADVTGLAEGFVGAVTDAEAIEHGLLAQTLAGVRVGVVPRPVTRGHHLRGSFGMTTEAGSGDLFAAGEWSLQLPEAAMVGRGSQQRNRQQKGQVCEPGQISAKYIHRSRLHGAKMHSLC